MNTKILRITIGLLCALWFCATPIELYAQRIKTIDDLFASYEQAKGVNYISLSPSLLKLMKDDLDEVMSNITSLKILTLDLKTQEQKTLAARIRTDALGLVKQENFEEIMKVREDQSEFSVYLSKKTHQAQALLLIADGNSELMLIGITGTISREVINAVLEGKIGIL